MKNKIKLYSKNISEQLRIRLLNLWHENSLFAKLRTNEGHVTKQMKEQINMNKWRKHFDLLLFTEQILSQTMQVLVNLSTRAEKPLRNKKMFVQKWQNSIKKGKVTRIGWKFHSSFLMLTKLNLHKAHYF